jgi:H/ACA ribonucleoprotein complex subunit 4
MLPYESRTSTIITKKESTTSPKYGSDPQSRPVEKLLRYGIINVDKQKGPTSHQVSAYIQKILGVNRAGHAGTLDPRVTGVLPIATGTATRIVQALINQGKEYVCLMHIHAPVDDQVIRASAKKLTGTIAQLPPIKSAVKRQLRNRTIYYLNILEINDQDVLFVVGCQAGTYIRKLCTDWGKLLDTQAHMVELRRTRAAGFSEDSAVSLVDVQDAYWFWKNEGNEKYIRNVIQPMERAIKYVPKIWVVDSAVESLCHGSNLNAPGISALESDIKVGNIVAVMTLKNELVGLGEAVLSSAAIEKMDRGICYKMQKIFMDAGTYPKITR